MIEHPCTPTRKRYVNGSFGLFQLIDAIAEYRLDVALNLMEDQLSQVAARKADKSPSRRAGKCIGRKSRNPYTASVYNPHFPDYISSAAHLRHQAHSICDVETCSPKINDVAPCSQARRRFYERGRKSVMRKPIGESRSRNSRARDQNSHDQK